MLNMKWKMMSFQHQILTCFVTIIFILSSLAMLYVYYVTHIQTTNNILLGLIIGSSSVIILSVIFSYKISKQIASPIDHLVEKFDRISHGEYGLQVTEADTETNHKELKGLSVSINKMSRSLQENFDLEKKMHQTEKMALVGELAAGSAHEIRNPLAVIYGFIQLLDQQLDADQREEYHLGLLKCELERINTIVEELLQVAKPGAPMRECHSIKQILVDILPLIKRHSQNIRIHDEIEPFFVYADPDQMKQVFHNLIRNSIDSIGSKGMIHITSRIEENNAHIIFSDNGKGIQKDYQAKIFEPFVTTKENGTGIGLTIIHRIVQNHGGDIVLESSNETGTVFRLTLPLGKCAQPSNLYYNEGK